MATQVASMSLVRRRGNIALATFDWIHMRRLVLKRSNYKTMVSRKSQKTVWTRPKWLFCLYFESEKKLRKYDYIAVKSHKRRFTCTFFCEKILRIAQVASVNKKDRPLCLASLLILKRSKVLWTIIEKSDVSHWNHEIFSQFFRALVRCSIENRIQIQKIII